MTDNRTTELLKDYAFTLRQLEYAVDKPGSNMTLGEYEAEEKRVTDEYAQAIAATLGEDEKLLDLAHHAWDVAVCAMQGMPIPASWGNAVEKGLRERGIDVDKLPYVVPDATLGDGEYEAKMDELLCRLTNGKWSKTRAYDLDFMESCINEEFEMLYAKEPADVELGNGTLTAEQVRETVLKHGNVMGPRFYGDWQEIADELNATMGEAVER